MSEQLAECRRVQVAYGSGEATVHALDDVSFQVETGERVALTGHSGSGKTTLLHVLGGLVEPTSGEVEWRGRPLASIDRAARGAERATGIGFVFQSSNLLPHFTALENLLFAASTCGKEPKEDDAQRLLTLVGLAGKGDNLPGELSGGEAQRVAIARALSQEPRLMLLDEPTGHLDSDTARRLLELIDRLQERERFALVVATHAPEVAQRYERVLELEDGRVAKETRR